MAEGGKVNQSLKIIIQAAVIVFAAAGTVLSYLGGRNAFMGGSAVFMYFTIQSNILIAVISAADLILSAAGKADGTAWQVIRLTGAVAITLTGIVFCFVLAPTMGSLAWNIQNILTHVAVPLLAVADLFLMRGRCKIGYRHVVFVMIPPLLYAAYASVGYIRGWQFSPNVNYPYFFLNWGSPAGAFGFTNGLPYMGCVWWIIAILVFLLAVGLLYIRILKSRPASAR